MSESHTWKWIQRIGALAGVVGLGLSLYALVRVDAVEDLISIAAGWQSLELTIDRPPADSAVDGHILEMAGQVRFEAHAPPRVESIRLQLTDHEIELLPFVRPVSEPLRWWPQPFPSVSDAGVVLGTVRLGEQEPIDNPMPFDVVILAVPRASVPRTETYESLPPHFAQSDVVRVVRLR